MCSFPTRLSEETAWSGLKQTDLFSQGGLHCSGEFRELQSCPFFQGASVRRPCQPPCPCSAPITSCLQGFCGLFDIPYLQSKQNVPFNTHHAKFINAENNPRGPTLGTPKTCQYKLFKRSVRQILQDNISHNGVKIIFFFGPFQLLLWRADRNYFLTPLPEQKSGRSCVYLFNTMISSYMSRQQIVGGLIKSL